MIGLIITAAVGYGMAVLFAVAGVKHFQHAAIHAQNEDRSALLRSTFGLLLSVVFCLAFAGITRLLTGGAL